MKPTNVILAELALVLGMPAEFFSAGRPISELPASSAHFRSLRSTPAISRDQALAFAEMALAVVDVLEQYVDLPPVADVISPVEHDDLTAEQIVDLARSTRNRLGVGSGPIPHVVRLLEARGIIALRLPPEVDHRVDAFSTSAGSRPLILLSDLKSDRARSRFDAAHELGHLVMHHHVDPGSKIIERQAHNFASEFLAPTSELEPDLPRRLDWDRLQRAKSKWGLSLAALVFRANHMGLWSEHTYRRANQFLRIQGYPEPGTLGPPESPYLLGGAMALLAREGTTTSDLARVSRLTVDQINEVVSAGRELKPRIRLHIDP